MEQQYGDTISVALHSDHVAVVEFDAPQHNFVNIELIRNLADAFEDLDARGDCRAIVLASAGATFCAGANFGTGAGSSNNDGARALYEQALRLYAIETPVVVAVQGAAIGAGLGLALVADFRIAAPEARFSANFVKLGFHPGFGLTHTLPSLIGAQRAKLMCLTGRRIKGDEALSWGLADQLVPLKDLRQASHDLAQEIAECAPLAVVATRGTLRREFVAAVRSATEIEFEKQSILRATEDFAEGIRSVAERRPGNFVGR